MKNKLEFIDAQEMQRKHPATFEAPDEGQLNELAPGWFAKVSPGKERFWVKLTEVNGDQLKGTVDNDLIYTDAHGLRCGDAVEFERRHVYQTSEPVAPKGWDKV